MVLMLILLYLGQFLILHLDTTKDLILRYNPQTAINPSGDCDYVCCLATHCHIHVQSVDC